MCWAAFEADTRANFKTSHFEVCAYLSNLKHQAQILAQAISKENEKLQGETQQRQVQILKCHGGENNDGKIQSVLDNHK